MDKTLEAIRDFHDEWQQKTTTGGWHIAQMVDALGQLVEELEDEQILDSDDVDWSEVARMLFAPCPDVSVVIRADGECEWQPAGSATIPGETARLPCRGMESIDHDHIVWVMGAEYDEQKERYIDTNDGHIIGELGDLVAAWIESGGGKGLLDHWKKEATQ